MKRILFVLLVIVPFVFLSAESAPKDVLRVGINTFPTNLNPVYTTDETSQAVVNKAFDSLFEFDSNGAIVKCLAKSFSYSNETEIHIQLKEGIHFSNGKELTSADVEATVDLLLNEHFNYPYASNLWFIENFKALGKYRLLLKTKIPIATWRNALTFKILCSAEIKEFETLDPKDFRDMQLSGTGPYMIAEIEPPNRVMLKLNPHAKIGSLYPSLHYTVVAYPYLVPLKLLNREIDICELQPEDIPVFQKKKSWRESFNILKYSKFGYTYLVFNLKNPAISTQIRKLLYNALVSGSFTAKFLRGRGETVKSPFMLLSPQVEAAAFPIEKISPAVSLKIMTNSESQMRKRFILFMKKELKPLGIELEPVFMEYHSFLASLKGKDFDMALSGFLLDIDYDMRDIFVTDSYFNYAGFASPELDRLLSNGLKELNTQKRKAIYLEAHSLWKRHLPILPLFNLYYYVGISNKVRIPSDTCRLMGSNGDFLQNIGKWTRSSKN